MNALWFTARGAGLSALLVLSLATSLGALASMRSPRLDNRIVLQYLHRTASVLGLLLVFVHVTTLVLDPKARVGLSGVLVPFASSYRPGAVALGSIAAYGFVLAAALGLARGRLASSARGARTWRALHASAYVAWGFAVLHGLTAGTDRGTSWVRFLALLCVVAVLGSLATRATSVEDERLVVAPRARQARGSLR